MSYDPACHTLAEHFLPSQASDQLKQHLAQALQDTVEHWLETEQERLVANFHAQATRTEHMAEMIMAAIKATGYEDDTRVVLGALGAIVGTFAASTSPQRAAAALAMVNQIANGVIDGSILKTTS